MEHRTAAISAEAFARCTDAKLAVELGGAESGLSAVLIFRSGPVVRNESAKRRSFPLSAQTEHDRILNSCSDTGMEKSTVTSQLSQLQRNSSEGQGSAPQNGFNPLVPELDVSDIGASLAFWCDYLGFHIVYDRPAAGFAFCEREAAQVMLCQVNGEWLTGPLERPFGRGINFQIKVENVEPTLAKLEEVGWPLFRGIQESWYRIGDEERGSREFLVLDPDGYLIRLSQSLGVRSL